MTEAERKASHQMPKSIQRIEKGVYRSWDDAIEIHQLKEGWIAKVLAEVEGRDLKKGAKLTPKPLKNRGDVVQVLDEQGLLPPAPPKAAKAKVERPKNGPEASRQGIGGRNGHSDQPATASGADGANGGTDRRPRKPRQRKVAAKV
jgi:hypothetical protein